jgi:surfactin synthase thioesterase subunit
MTSPWFPFWRPNPEARLRLFCFPYAGGSASVFQRWTHPSFSKEVEVLAAQYPGHETRLREPLHHSVPELVHALGPSLQPLLDRPYAFLGYSMGCLVSLELTHWLRRQGAPAPLGLLLAASTPPHQRKIRRRAALPDKEFISEVTRYGGMPAPLLESKELMELLLPVLRADLEMVDEYHGPVEPPLSLPFAIWGGQEDIDPAPQALEGWRDLTTGSVDIQLIPGGHFFLLSAGDMLRKGVEQTLRKWAP